MGEVVADIVIFSGVPRLLTYAVPFDMRPQTGCRVIVPVRTSRRTGLIIALRTDSRSGLKPIITLLDDTPLIPGELIDLLLWTARYYHSGIGACLALAFPPYLRQGRNIELAKRFKVFRTGAGTGRIGKKQEKILISIEEDGMDMETLRSLYPGSSSSVSGLIKSGYIEQREVSPVCPRAVTPVELTVDQLKAFDEISGAIDLKQYRAYILHGITGSGKTEVYLSCAMKALSSGMSVIYMVPEINLTPQTIAMVKKRIPFETAVFHSALSPTERAREFIRVVSGGVRFVLGTRSSIFAPLKDIGLIIVDEEHDGSYKQEDGVPYNARDLSLMRARNNNAVAILGSATPSMDTFVKAGKGAGLLVMPSRVGSSALPEVDIVDMRGIKDPISDDLLEAIEETVARKEQALLFINRRGFSTAMVCPGCGKPLVCNRCDSSLTYHKSKGTALCHYCAFEIKMPEICPKCGCLDMKPIGLGTEQIMEEVKRHLPGLRYLKMDSDEITTPARLASALNAIRNRDVDVIVGTQMIAKGHDFPDLTLVGVLHAEQMLFMPDFRAGERTFQQIVQVAGRAGRRKSGTRVLIQTLIPDNPLIRAIACHDYQAMISAEDLIRQSAGFPPYAHMARLIFSSYQKMAAETCSSQASERLNHFNVELFGPAPAPIEYLRKRYRWHIMMTSKDRNSLHRALGSIENMNRPSNVRLKIDVDPYNML